MNRKGVCYDVGVEMGMNWRPHFDPVSVRRELEIIKNDLHCNALRIAGRDIKRLQTATRDALDLGLEVWFSPAYWDKSPEETLAYFMKAAEAAEAVRHTSGDKLVFTLGGELTLFMQGILEGRNLRERLRNPNMLSRVKAGEHNPPLNRFLAKANESVRSVFHGKVAYASLVWEEVNWDKFDFVGVDHYRTPRMGDTYLKMLEPAFGHGKPVVVTEFGFSTTHGAIGEGGLLRSTAGLEESIINLGSQFLHYRLPLVGRFVRPRLNGKHIRDEGWQAKQLVETLEVLDKAGVDGAFVSQFESQITPYSDDPRYDLDMASSSLVKYFEGGRKGTTYPEMPWEPKESFWALAEYYGGSKAS
jgi:hypothetical protein